MTKEAFLAKYKPGDVIIFGHWIVIFAEFVRGRFYQNKSAIVYHALACLEPGYDHLTICKRTGIGYIEDYDEEGVRLAINDEKRDFFDKLKRNYASWDDEKGEIVMEDANTINERRERELQTNNRNE
jgi:hypothetical protein